MGRRVDRVGVAVGWGGGIDMQTDTRPTTTEKYTYENIC